MKDFMGNTLSAGDTVIFHLDFYDTHKLELGKIISFDDKHDTIYLSYLSLVGSPVSKETGERVWSEVINHDRVKSNQVYKR